MQTAKIIELNALKRQYSQQGHSPDSKPKILFVDDEERILKSMRALFRRDYHVTVCTDGHQALELLAERHFHLIVSDQRMPLMNGVDLLCSAKTVSPTTVRILLTGYADLAAIIGSVNDGEVYRFLNKPWDNDEFSTTIAEAVDVGLKLEAGHADAMKVPVPEATVIDNTLRTEPDDGIEDELATTQVATLNVDSQRDKQLLVVNGDQALNEVLADLLPDTTPLLAVDYGAAGELIAQHEVGIIICHVEGDYQQSLAFFSLLKQEHPEIISIILADNADSGMIIDLINHARVYRYMFKPLRVRLMARYLEAAIKQHQNYLLNPVLLEQQQAESIPSAVLMPTAITAAGVSEPLEDDSVPTTSLLQKIQRLFRRVFLS